mmetsp:Transcript_7478/g.21286  ORF Transcript_7478/g.21286 Transcript_7478/m.21286 type:complete len:200 (-) Transcript_7478:235-834(-)
MSSWAVVAHSRRRLVATASPWPFVPDAASKVSGQRLHGVRQERTMPEATLSRTAATPQLLLSPAPCRRTKRSGSCIWRSRLARSNGCGRPSLRLRSWLSTRTSSPSPGQCSKSRRAASGRLPCRPCAERQWGKIRPGCGGPLAAVAPLVSARKLCTPRRLRFRPSLRASVAACLAEPLPAAPVRPVPPNRSAQAGAGCE